MRVGTTEKLQASKRLQARRANPYNIGDDVMLPGDRRGNRINAYNKFVNLVICKLYDEWSFEQKVMAKSSEEKLNFILSYFRQNPDSKLQDKFLKELKKL
ncbi:MAG: hypothetical protein LBL34_01415 [Clostridiales bacterium]|jgi:hypothetical protein|nr:hypothetical protein [Clostridiales bacterium]